MSKKDEKETKKKPTSEEKENSSSQSNETKIPKKEETQVPVPEPTEKEKVEQLQKEISNLKQEKEKLLLMLANLDNQQKNLQKQMLENYKYGNERIIKWIVEFLIGLEERSLKPMRNDSSPAVKAYEEGIEAEKINLWSSLENEGVKEIEIKVGTDQWDGKFHKEFGKEKNEKLPERTIVRVIEKGYLLHDKVISKAKVVISEKTEPKN